MTGRHKRSKKPLTPLEKAEDIHWFGGGRCDSRLIYSRLVYENEFTIGGAIVVQEFRCLRCGKLIGVTK